MVLQNLGSRIEISTSKAKLARQALGTQESGVVAKRALPNTGGLRKQQVHQRGNRAVATLDIIPDRRGSTEVMIY